jgi:hypothetical protein
VTVKTLVPWMEPGDLVYSRGRVLQASSAARTEESAPMLVDKAPFPPAE